MGGFVLLCSAVTNDPLKIIACVILAVGFLLAGCAHMLADEIRKK